MVFGVSTMAFKNRVLRVEQLEKLRKARYRHIELFANRPHLDYRDRGLTKDIAGWFNANGMPPPSVHMPFYEQVGPSSIRPISALASEERLRLDALDELKRALELSDRMPLSYVVIHLGTLHQEFHPVAFDHAYAMVDTIRSFAGVEILIENIPNEISTLERIRKFTHAARLPDVRICYDTGHGHLQGPIPRLEGVAAIHLNDNGRELDDHLWPFEGTLDWPRLIEEIAMSDYHGPMVFEVHDEDVERGWDHRARIQDLLAQARSSLDEFREKYGLRRNDDDDLH